MKKYIIQVAPLVPLPVLRTQVFSYWHDEPLPIGTLVSIPFYFREIEGIVVKVRGDISQTGSFKLKNIRAVKEKNFLNENQIDLARRIAEYYFSPLGSVLKLMIPKIVQRREKNKKISKKTIQMGKAGEIALRILKSDKKKFFLAGNAKQREKTNVDLIRACLKRNKQCLILAPEIFFSQSIFDKLQGVFSEEIALIHSKITKGQYCEFWKKIKDGQIKIVIASKMGIFLPFLDLGLIVVQEDQDPSFKQWKAMPRYNGARGAEFLAQISGAKLVLESFAPSVENLYQSRENDLEILSLNSNLPKIEITFLDKVASSATRRGGGNADFPISGGLYSRLAEIVKSKKQAVVFMNRRGFSTRTICENCKKPLKCPKCDLALVFSDEHSEYHCLHCTFKMDLLSSCPTCGGFQFIHRGIGTQTVEKKIKRLFPSARVVRLDADVMKSQAKYKSILREFLAGEIDILVGTQSAIKGIYSENIKLAASISGKDFADEINFNSRALALSRVFNMANLLSEDGVLLIQSFFGGSPLFDFLEKKELKKYFTQELAMRKRLGYPPFRKLVKLSFRDKSEKRAASETKKAFDLLRATGNNTVEIIGPYIPFSGEKKGIYTRNILIKCDPEKNISDLPIRAVIGGLGKGWSVDVDPISIM
ncbi:MAG TPA: primosomal protein N' [Candidatus Saccharimonadales bacterium]|nr:primosomal protein N' [Candidatus Saccharimonadales bacterium]